MQLAQAQVIGERYKLERLLGTRKPVALKFINDACWLAPLLHDPFCAKAADTKYDGLRVMASARSSASAAHELIHRDTFWRDWR